MSLKNHIERMAWQIANPMTFLYGTASELNVQLEDVKTFPVVFMYAIQQTNGEFKESGGFDDKVGIYLEFLDLTEAGEFSEQTLAVQDRMSHLRDKFLSLLPVYKDQGEKYFKVKAGDKYKSINVFNPTKYDTDLAGVNLEIDLRTIQRTKFSL